MSENDYGVRAIGVKSLLTEHGAINDS
jgi:hypothetical protein